MQYVTTRSNDKTYNWLHALNDDRGEDGGFFIPAQLPAFTQEQIEGLALKNPNQALAEILNLFFDSLKTGIAGLFYWIYLRIRKIMRDLKSGKCYNIHKLLKN